MASRKNQLLAASFKGVSFFVSSESQPEAGRKIAIHEYADSDQRFVEDLGQLVPTYNVQAFISGDNWLDRSRALDRVLNKKGPGSLVMPTFGSSSAYALPYKKDASQQSVGIISYSLTFALGKPANAPATTIPTSAEVFAKGDLVRSKIETSFAENWVEPTLLDSIKTGIADVKDAVGNVLSTIADKIDVETLQQLTKKVNEISSSTPSVFSDPSLLAQQIIQGTTDDPGVWQLASLGFGSSGAISAFNTLCEYGESLIASDSGINGASVTKNKEDETSATVPYWKETTEDRVVRNDVRRLLVRNNRLNALIGMYEQVAAGNYNTTEDVQNARNAVESQYNNIILSTEIGADALQSDPNVRLVFEDLRAASLAVLRNKKQESFAIVDITQKTKTSSFVLAYNLYKEVFLEPEALTERAILVRDLNPELSTMGLVGDISVVQNEVD